jgi:uncharacterized protein
MHSMASQIFVNLPVKDLQKSIAFFTKLGFTFNPKFTNENGTCMIVGENIFVMLLVEPFFQTFTKKQIVDANQTTEAILAITVESRAAVDTMITTAIAAGGKESRPVEDHGWMYTHAFEDLDGHIWEPFYADESLLDKQ